jgi:cell division protein FtsW
MTAIQMVGKKSNRVQASIKFKFDYWLALTIGALCIIGLMMVFSTTFDYGVLWRDGDATYFFRRQLLAFGIGAVGFIVVMQFDYHTFRRFSVPMMLGTLILLLFTLFFSESFLGAARGLQGGSYQPSEVAKLAMVLYISHWLSTKGDKIKDIAFGLVPFSIITGIVCSFIVQQPDLSTATLIAVISYTMYWVAGADWRQFAIAGIIGAVVFVLLISVLPHAQDRVQWWLTGLRQPDESSYHVQQSLIALANGGWTGLGPGNSKQKFGPLPAAHTDSVFAVLAEEFGLLGSLAVIGLLGVLVWRGFRTATKARDSYGALLAIGITSWIGLQALINIAVITAVVPFTGLPLPFLSYGGSSMAITLVACGILLNISRDAGLDSKAAREHRKQSERRQDSDSGRKRSSNRTTKVKMEAVSEADSMRRRHRRSYLPGARRTK